MKIDPGALEKRETYKLLISCVVPRPIAFVSTRSKAGTVNLAPFSFFNAVAASPPVVMFSVGRRRNGEKKDTHRNIEESGECVVNIVVQDLMDGVIVGARDLPPEESELEMAKLTAVPSEKVKPPRVGESPISLECTLHQIVTVGSNAVIFARIEMFHVRDEILREGRVDPALLPYVGRLGDDYYEKSGELFERKRT